MRGTYKQALRAKGIRPIPPMTKLRSSLTTDGQSLEQLEAARG